MIKVSFPPHLKQAIERQVIDPIFNHSSTPAWDKEVRNKIINGTFEPLTKTAHRNTIVQQGQGDFINGTAGLNAHDVALLYAYYYFQMHFTSTIALFYQNRNVLINDIFKAHKKIIFLDVGCGPYTSGLSFLHFTRLAATKDELTPLKNDCILEYYGIDNSVSMRTLGNAILTDYSTINDNSFTFAKVEQCADYNDIPQLIGKQDNQPAIILNCCYFFASQSLKVADLTTAIQLLLNNNPKSKILLFYQNANSDLDRLRVNFRIFKETIKGLVPTGNVEQLPFSFDDEFNATNYTTFNNIAKVQLLKNY